MPLDPANGMSACDFAEKYPIGEDPVTNWGRRLRRWREDRDLREGLQWTYRKNGANPEYVYLEITIIRLCLREYKEAEHPAPFFHFLIRDFYPEIELVLNPARTAPSANCLPESSNT